jgi:hypothetical protein
LQFSDEKPKFEEPEKFNIAELMERIKKSDGKLKKGEDFKSGVKELERFFDKIFKGVRAENDNERKELKKVFEARKKDIDNERKINYRKRDELVAQTKVNAYDFLKTVRFTINTRPAFHGFKKMSNEDFQELERLANDPAALQDEFLNEKYKLTDLQERIADTMIYEQTNMFKKSGSFLWEKTKALGKSFVWLVNKLSGRKSNEETSGERIQRLEREKVDEENWNKKRRKILKDAVKKIRKNPICQELKEPIHSAIYGEEKKANGDPMYALKQDMQARLGAQAVNSVVNTKFFPDGISFTYVFH